MMKRNKCKMCRACCQNIPMSKDIFDKRYMRRNLPVIKAKIVRSSEIAKANNKFIMDHWKVISKTDTDFIFECDCFDKETNLCTVHENKPPICRDFPYGGANLKEKLPEGCGFKNE